jgi:hypothetical protein
MKNVLSCAIEAKLGKPYVHTDNKIHLVELLMHTLFDALEEREIAR